MMELRIKELEKENYELKLIIQLLRKEIEELKAKLNMNSSNSSFPPSSDKFKKKDKNRSLRKKSEKKSGGQLGHKGSTLQKVQDPDFVVELPNDTCSNCSHDLTKIEANTIKSRQIFDIPEIKINVTEFRAHSKTCPHCHAKTTSEFPKNLTHSAQYGPNIKGLILNLNIYQSLPYKRLQELLNDVFNLKLSQGTVYNTLKSGYDKLEKVEEFFKGELAKSAVAHADETGTKVNGINRWIHSFSNDSFTVLTAHKNRGKKAIVEAGIIEKFNGILVHDCWYAYDSFNNFTHALCWAHFLRELQSIQDNTKLKFPENIKNSIFKLKSIIESDKKV
ncbi:MAG: IS66 family transposase, partial [Cetobacterium sp.]